MLHWGSTLAPPALPQQGMAVQLRGFAPGVSNCRRRDCWRLRGRQWRGRHTGKSLAALTAVMATLAGGCGGDAGGGSLPGTVSSAPVAATWPPAATSPVASPTPGAAHSGANTGISPVPNPGASVLGNAPSGSVLPMSSVGQPLPTNGSFQGGGGGPGGGGDGGIGGLWSPEIVPGVSSLQIRADGANITAPIAQDGTFSLTGLAPGSYTISVLAPDGSIVHQQAVQIDPGATVLTGLLVQTVGRVSGVVTTKAATGKIRPVIGAQVTLTWQNPQPVNGSPGPESTSGGMVALTHSVVPPQPAPISLQPSGQSGVTSRARYSRLGSYRGGERTRQTEQPVPTPASAANVFQTVTAVDGAYSIERVPAGYYRIEATDGVRTVTRSIEVRTAWKSIANLYFKPPPIPTVEIHGTIIAKDLTGQVVIPPAIVSYVQQFDCGPASGPLIEAAIDQFAGDGADGSWPLCPSFTTGLSSPAARDVGSSQEMPIPLGMSTTGFDSAGHYTITSEIPARTDPQGHYSMQVPINAVAVKGYAYGFVEQSQPVSLQAGGSVEVDFTLEPVAAIGSPPVAPGAAASSLVPPVGLPPDPPAAPPAPTRMAGGVVA